MLYVTSDLHYGLDQAGDRATLKLASYLEKHSQPNDILCLAGDIGSDDESFVACLRTFDGFQGTKCAIAGNHDIWVESGSSFDKHNRLQDEFKKHGFHALEKFPLIVDGLTVVGSIGWYDYTYRDEGLGLPLLAYERKAMAECGSPVWNDALYAHWGMSDIGVTDMTLGALEGQLATIDDKAEVVVITHHLTTSRLLFHPRWLVPEKWRFANAFLGSERYAQLFSRFPNVKLSICGHVHRSAVSRMNGLTFTSIGSDYRSKRLIGTIGSKLVCNLAF